MKYRHGDKAACGIVAALSALKTDRMCACGCYPDLVDLGRLAVEWNFNLIQLLPLNDSGSQTSPYSARSAFALHPLYIKIEALPELSSAVSDSRSPALLAASSALDAEFCGDARLRYGQYFEAKLRLLRKIWDEIASGLLGGKSGRALDAWIEANPWVRAYAVFSELKDRNGGKPWWEWSEHRDPRPSDIEVLWKNSALASGLRFRAWLQWRAEEQFSAAASALADMGIELMGDLPIMIDKDSADVWSRREVFSLGQAAGAPPDMYSALGQNWGFPIYDWEAAGKDGYSFWKARLAQAAKFYSAYRIDHVLGFFRIWTMSEYEETGCLGRFIPDSFISRGELSALGFDAGRIRWLSQPHIKTADLIGACGSDTDAMEAARACLDRIGSEELFLFKAGVRGERDIRAALRPDGLAVGSGLSHKAMDYLLSRWHDRVLYEFAPGCFTPTCSFNAASAWPTLSGSEQASLNSLIARRRAEGEAGWEAHGRKLLSVLKNSCDMLPCAEDLGSVPGCVPRVLGELGVLGLRVLRWTRDWGSPGQPYIALDRYPELSVACPSVHDSSALREWWEKEADREQLWKFVAASLGENLGPAPDRAEPRVISALLRAVAGSSSRIAVFPIQDLLGLDGKFSAENPSDERVNVPGTSNDWNWGWRLPAPLGDIASDRSLSAAAQEVSAGRKH